MKIRGVQFKFKTLICLALYYGIAQYLPVSRSLWGGEDILDIN